MNAILPKSPARPSEPGAKRGPGSVVLGVILMLIGVPMLVLPGPGTVLVVAGVGLIASGLRVRREGDE